MKLQIASMTPADAGKFLRNMAELTARNSQNWDNFEAIASGLIQAAYEASPVMRPKGGGPDAA